MKIPVQPFSDSGHFVPAIIFRRVAGSSRPMNMTGGYEAAFNRNIRRRSSHCQRVILQRRAR